MVAIRDSFGLSAADYTSLLNHFGLNAEAIEAAVKSLLS
jgi:transketolase C-terminal domain/subunit